MRPTWTACAVLVLTCNFTSAQTVDELTKKLKDGDANVRRVAAEALGKQKVEAAIPALAELLKDREGSVRNAAGEALVRIGPKSFPALTSALAAAEENSRLAALEALRRLAPSSKNAIPKETLAGLTKALKDKSTDVRIYAAVALGEIGPAAKSTLPALFDAGKDTANLGGVLRPTLPSSVTEAAIAAALQVNPNCTEALAKHVLFELTAALKSKDQGTLMGAGFALAKLGTHAKPAQQALQEAQKTTKGFAESAITAALTAIGGDALTPLFDVIKDPKAPLDKRRDALRELGWSRSTDDKAVAVLIDALKDPKPEIRAAAVDAISTVGAKAKNAVPVLIDLLGDEEIPKVTSRIGISDPVTEALSRMGTEAVRPLADTLQNKEKKPLVRFQSAKALALLGRKARSAMPQLEAGMKDEIAPIATESACAYSLAGGDVSKAMPLLKQALKHKAPFVLWNAARAVERLGPEGKDAVPELLPLLKHQDAEIRIVAAHALSKIGSPAKESVPIIADLSKSKDGRQRAQMEKVLEQFGPDAREALPVLIENLKSMTKMFPHPTLVTIGKIGPDAKPAIPALIELLKNGDSTFTNDTMNALGEIGPEAKVAVPTIMTFLENKSEFSRASAVRALGKIGPEAKAAVPALRKRLEDESKSVRAWAAFALVRVAGDKSGVPMLLELWKEDDGEPFRSARYDIAQALGLLGNQARPARDLLLEAVLDVKTPLGVREQVARTLGQMSEDAEVIVPKLVGLLEEKSEGVHRVWNCEMAIEALSRLGPKAKAAVPVLRKLLDDEENKIADAAAKALKSIEGK